MDVLVGPLLDKVILLLVIVGVGTALVTRLPCAPGWVAALWVLDEALRAIEHLPKCRFFTQPATLFQLCGAGFVTRVLAGQYDEAKPVKAARVDPAAPPPPRVDPGFAAAREATERRERERMEAEHRRLDEKATSATGTTGPRLKLVTQGGEVP
jgi:hypothetical protein